MDRYEDYQEVDSYWYNQVPSYWEKTKNKYVFCQEKYVVGEDWENFTLLTMGKSGVKPRDMDGGGKFPASFENYQTVEPNQLIFCLFDLDETPRTIGMSKDYGMITSAYDVFSTTEGNDPQFWTYFYQMIDDHKGLRPFYTGLRKVVRSETFMGIEVFSPPLDEQKLISRYLDKKTEQIHSLIEKIKKKIELLKEQRTSLINQCVTKGLDPNVEMKDSGVEWIGEIPKHWDNVKITYLIDVRDGTHDTPSYVDEEGIPLVTQKDIYGGVLDFSKTKKISSYDHEQISKRSKVNKNDIIMSMIGSIGYPTVVDTDKEFSIKNVCLFRTSVSDQNPYFVKYCLESSSITEQLELNKGGGVQSFVSLDTLRYLRVLIPEPEEQETIVRYLSKKLGRIDQLINKESRRVDLLTEYHQSLISSVVTGKVRVTEDMI